MTPPTILTKRSEGSSLVEFAIALPLLVVFVVGVYDFSGAFNEKQKIEHAALEGATVAGAQPMTDIDPANGNPDSLQPVVAVVFNSLAANGVLANANQGSCKLPAAGAYSGGLTWTYTFPGCANYASGDTLQITIDRGWVPTGATPPVTVGTQVTVQYWYHWHFNSAIQLLFPGAAYNASTQIVETATVHNQM